MKIIKGSKELTEDEVNEIVEEQCEGETPSQKAKDSPELIKLKNRYTHLGVTYQLLSQGLFLGNHCEAISDGMKCLDELYKETHEAIQALTKGVK